MASPIRIRRPVHLGAPKQVEGEGSHVDLPSRFGCEKPEVLWKDLELKAFQACLSTLKKQIAVKYQLMLKAQPELVLVSEEETPACLKESLPKIPVPREFFFTLKEGQKRECYATGLRVDPESLRGSESYKEETVLNLILPIDPPPQNQKEFQSLVLGWSLTPFYWQKEDRRFISKYVPEGICQICFGEGEIPQEELPENPSWPY